MPSCYDRNWAINKFMNKNILKSGLYIVSLPIGNLNDITSRAKDTISNSDYILCEDTRNTLKILNYF